jgi:hypothetical protein
LNASAPPSLYLARSPTCTALLGATSARAIKAERMGFACPRGVTATSNGAAFGSSPFGLLHSGRLYIQLPDGSGTHDDWDGHGVSDRDDDELAFGRGKRADVVGPV